MDSIIPLKGNVRYQLTLDPGVWIFDDRKIDFTTYFNEERLEENELEKYTKSVSEHWDREIREGAAFPPIQTSVKKFQKQKILTGTFAIPIKYFLDNAEINEGSIELVIKTKQARDFHIPLAQAFEGLLLFSNCGKPLTEDGPVYFYFGDGSNKEAPIKEITEFVIK
jgi:hypothetical protein